jgi:DNA-binding SARP family transcriptional activator
VSAPLAVPFRLQLLGGFSALRHGAVVELPSSTWRLVAFLALAGRPVERAYLANSLWLDKSEDRAYANLRTCLWRLRQACEGLICGTRTHLSLCDDVSVDVRELVRFSRLLADEKYEIDPETVDPDWFCAELLPDWYDDFVETEREHLRQLRLHALEALAGRHLRVGRTDVALEIALTAVAAGPLRESAHRLVISIHLLEGNISEALRHYDRLCALLGRELGIGPSSAIQVMVAPYRSVLATPL